ncbi:MAG: tRNA (adenosine(37)-N6)-threonylcarbamoyltransferase complex dimerization subunit type 1 TsaB [Nitrospirota bacterium]
MLTLGINTASSFTGIALLQDGKLIGENSWQSHNDEAEKLMPAIAEILEKGGAEFSQIEKVIVISGPGSFTGLRVGVTVANTIAYLNGCELYAVDTFEYWWAKEIPGENLLIFAGSKAVYVNREGKTETVNLYEVPNYLHNKNIEKVFGDITEEQKKAIGGEFIETEETFGQTLEKLAKKDLKSVKIVKPNYIKQPEITKSKKQCCI